MTESTVQAIKNHSSAPPIERTDVKRVYPALSQRLAGLPILYKILIANISIVVLGAIAGTWITTQLSRRATSDHYVVISGMFAIFGIVASLLVNFFVLRAAFRPLAALEQSALAIKDGDFSVRAVLTAEMDPQIAHLAETLNATLDELALDRAELRSLASQVIRAQEDERRRIARELHDDTAQVLFAQLLRLAALKASPDPTVQAVAAGLEEMTVEALEGVRRLALEMRPPALDDLGLSAALGELAQRFSEQLVIPIDYEARGHKGRLPAEVELVLYRVAQETLTNISKHAQATRVSVDVDRTSDDVSISIRDNGLGFESAEPRSSDGRGLGLGIFGMEERVALVGGRFRIWSRPTIGTEVFAFVPLSPEGKVIGTPGR